MAPKNLGAPASGPKDLVTKAELDAAAGQMGTFTIDGGTWTTNHSGNLRIFAGGWS